MSRNRALAGDTACRRISIDAQRPLNRALREPVWRPSCCQFAGQWKLSFDRLEGAFLHPADRYVRGPGFIKQSRRIRRRGIEKSQDAFNALGRCVERDSHNFELDRRPQGGGPNVGRRKQPGTLRPDEMRTCANLLAGTGDIDADKPRFSRRPDQVAD